MAKDTKIEWANHTVNLWWGCSKVHTGCKNCYAESLSNRYGDDVWGEKKPRKLIKSAFKDLAKYQKEAEQKGVKYRVFVGSMMDIFEDSKNLITNDGLMVTLDGEQAETKHLRDDLFNRIIAGEYNNIVFLFLTKRPENIAKYIPQEWGIYETPENVYFGTSISDQETADDLIPKLLFSGVNNRFLSVEPQTGDIDLKGYLVDKEAVEMGVLKQPIKWVIQGGESGNKKRPFNLDWAYKMREQCKEAGIPYFFKQIDKVKPIPQDLEIREIPKI